MSRESIAAFQILFPWLAIFGLTIYCASRRHSLGLKKLATSDILLFWGAILGIATCIAGFFLTVQVNQFNSERILECEQLRCISDPQIQLNTTVKESLIALLTILGGGVSGNLIALAISKHLEENPLKEKPPVT